MIHDLVVMFEHPEWQKPLFKRLDTRRVHYAKLDLKKACFDPDNAPKAFIYFNQASPSAYKRNNTRAVPLALALMRSLEEHGALVLNGSSAFALELSKSYQAALMQKLKTAHPRTLAFNDAETGLAEWGNQWPALLKPDQGGSGARMLKLYSSDDFVRKLEESPDIWLPENLLLLQEFFETDPSKGIVRMEFLDGQLLYAMRVFSADSFNLCPAETCDPLGENSKQDLTKPNRSPRFVLYKDVPPAAIETGKRIMEEGGLNVGGIEYLEASDGRLVFYDINANSNLRTEFYDEETKSNRPMLDFDPFDRVADYLLSQVARVKV